MNKLYCREGKSWSANGQAMVEFLVILPVMLMLLLGAIQFALIYHAKITLNYAAFEAVRAGTLNNAEFTAVKSGFARGMAPLYSYSADDSDQVGAFKEARQNILDEFDSDTQLIRIERLNPTAIDFKEFGKKIQDNTGRRITQIPNDNLRYRSSKKVKKSHSSIQDANLLHLRFTYWYPLYVPLVNKLIFNTIICCKKGETDELIGTCRWENDPVCLQDEPRIPLTATAAMRMQTPPNDNQTGYTQDRESSKLE